MARETGVLTEASPRAEGQVWPEWVYPYTAGIGAGLLGGFAVAAVGFVYGLLSGQTWLPVNAVAATVVRDMQLRSVEELSRFDMVGLLVGGLFHLLVSVSLGMAFAFILPALPGRPIVWGPIVAPLLLIGATVAVLPLVNPVMAANLDWPSFGLANILFGVAIGWWFDRTPLVRVRG